jgi:adenylate cyclase
METPSLRQPLAVVFCDIAGTTRLMAQEGDLVTSGVLRDFYEHSGRLGKEHGCVLIKFIGDGFLAAFEIAGEVLPFARSVQSLFQTLPALSGRGLQFRFSIHYGDVLCIETSYGKDVLGDEINLAAHLNDLAQPGQVVISQAAFDRMPAEQQGLAGPGETVRVRSGHALRPAAGRDMQIRRITLLAA